MRCLFFIEDYPITPDSPGGAPALSYSHLELLAHAGAEVHLVILTDPRHSLGFQQFTASQPQVWAQVRSWCASYRQLEIEYGNNARAPFKHFWQALHDPVLYVCGAAQPPVLQALQRVVHELEPELLWAEHRVPAMLACLAVPQLPIVYSHHDWEWLLARQRLAGRWATARPAQKLRGRFGVWQMRRAESETVRTVTACVSGSVTETAEFKKLGARHAAYLPTTYEPVTLSPVSESTAPVRVVHLGGMLGTRNQTSVQRFLDLAWNPSCAAHAAAPELWQVGSMKGAPPEILAALARAGAHCTGFVRDLQEVLRPGDIHVVPWEWPTGTRTRIPVAMNHGQALVSTRAAAVCLPELKHGENCLLVNDLPELGRAVAALVADPVQRRQLAAAGRATFLQHYTRPALQPRFQQFLSELGWPARRQPRAVAQWQTSQT